LAFFDWLNARQFRREQIPARRTGDEHEGFWRQGFILLHKNYKE
jgi:hypothetical protein